MEDCVGVSPGRTSAKHEEKSWVSLRSPQGGPQRNPRSNYRLRRGILQDDPSKDPNQTKSSPTDFAEPPRRGRHQVKNYLLRQARMYESCSEFAEASLGARQKNQRGTYGVRRGPPREDASETKGQPIDFVEISSNEAKGKAH